MFLLISLVLLMGYVMVMIIIVRVMREETVLIVQSNSGGRKLTLFPDGMLNVLVDQRKENRLVCLLSFRPSGWQAN